MKGPLRRVTAVAAWTVVAVVVLVTPATATHCSGCIDADDIATGAVGTSEIVAGGVASSEILNGSVSLSDLAASAKVTADSSAVTLVDNMNGPLRTLTSLPLGIGTWWINVTFEVDNKTEGQDVYVDCWLRSGSTSGTILDHRNMHLEIGDGGVGNSQSVAFQSVRTLLSATTIYVTCDPASTPDNLDAEYVRMTALKIANSI